MIKFNRNVVDDEHGVAVAEFAIIAPVFLVLLFGLFQTSIMFFANAGLQQAVEAGARYATTYPRPTEALIKSKVLSSGYGLNSTKISGPNVVYGTRNGMPYAEISMNYTMEMDFVFYSSDPIILTHKRLAYLAPTG